MFLNNTRDEYMATYHDDIPLVTILGNKLKSKSIHQELKGRVDVAIKIFKQEEKNALMLCSGGQSNPKVKRSEAQVMKQYILSKKIPKNKILTEKKSLDTIGNAFYSRKKLQNKKIEPTTIYVVSSCYHMERAEYIFKMCFGDNYKLDFGRCYHHEIFDEREENRSMRLAKDFFNGIKKGDIKDIEKKIFTEHKLYRSNK